MSVSLKVRESETQPVSEGKPQCLRDCVTQAMNNYFEQLDGQDVVELYELVLSEVEAPLMEAVMTYTNGNQTKASQITGLNRGTLRKKLKKYGML